MPEATYFSKLSLVRTISQTMLCQRRLAHKSACSKSVACLATALLAIVFCYEYFHESSGPGEYLAQYKGTENSDLDRLLKNLLARKQNCIRCKNSEEFANCFCGSRFLSCNEITSTDLVIGKKLGGGIGKLVYSAKWGENVMALLETRTSRIGDDWIVERVQNGFKNIVNWRSSPFVIPSYGFCVRNRSSYLLTESCSKYGDLYNFMQTETFKNMDAFGRFKMAVQIVAAFHFLHTNLDRPRVHCDLHTAEESTKQFLVADDLRIFMSDLDELPSVDIDKNTFANCKEESRGIMKQSSFIAPEQRYTVQEFKKKISQKPITEKSDIWKIPDITNLILTENKEFDAFESNDSEFMKKLKQIHELCKETDPLDRPSSKDVLIEYLKVLQQT